MPNPYQLLDTLHRLEALLTEAVELVRREIEPYKAVAEPAPERPAPDPALPDRFGDRLVMNPDVSTDSPCVKGTWVTVAHVISQIVDGWSWSDILRAHPELTDDDIRACLVYTVADEETSITMTPAWAASPVACDAQE